MGRLKGIEPSDVGITTRCVNHFATIATIIFLKKMGRLKGIEPSNVGITTRCVNHFATTATILFFSKKTGAVGFEPTPKVLETFILPLNYAPINWWWGADSNCRTHRERIYSPPRLATSLPHQVNYSYLNTNVYMVPEKGLEPSTY